MGERTICLIPARGGSKRLERKNVKNLDGKPLIAYTIEAATESGVFDRVIVSTEDDEIARVSEQYGAEVPFTRPYELATDTAQVVNVTDHALEAVQSEGDGFDRLAVLLPTTPLRTADDVRAASETFEANAWAEFLMCVTDYSYSPFEALRESEGRLEQFWEKEYYSKRSQDRPDLVVDNGAMYLMNVEAYERERTFYGEDLTGHYMPPERSVDIDEAFDLELAEFLLQR